jgi:predicted amidophosphoribosyltransferase
VEGYRALILDALFPRRCVGCGTFGLWCCDECRGKIELARRDQDIEGLDGVAVIGFYHDPVWRKLIHGLKYDSATDLIHAIGPVIARAKEERNAPWPWAGEESIVIQSVIGSTERVRARGFDQADVIRDLMKQELLSWATEGDLLERASSSIQPQAELEPGPLRSANVHDAFRVRPNLKDIPCTVILIDDVITTGSTMREAARVLREAGVEKIYGVALAVGK